MRRLVAIAACALVAALLVALPATGADDGPYLVRAYFDNGGFIVKDEEVRIAGATVGTVQSVDISRDDEIVSLEDGGRAIPGKAVVVLQIENDGFKDFREDASCLIRPQSLIGEKFLDCKPTQPRAPGSEIPPELEVIEDGERGEGQRMLPLENNGKSIDIDLINNINRAPYRDRFRIILNDLGAGLAARGDDLGEVIDRANPALRETNQVLDILADQNDQLASLASDGDAVLQPLADNRTSITGFFRNAGIAGQASAERGEDLEAGLEKLPRTLREVRLTMTELEKFSDKGTVLSENIGASAVNVSKATQNLAPLARAGIPAFETLGDGAEAAGPKIADSKPVLDQLATLGDKTGPLATDLSALLDTFTRTQGWSYLMDFIYNTTGSINGYDAYGHFQRAVLQITVCQDYEVRPASGCQALFQKPVAAPTTPAKKKKKKKKSSKSSLGPAIQSPSPSPVPPLDVPPIDELLPELDPEEPADPNEPADPDEPAAPADTEDGDDADAPKAAAAARRLEAAEASGEEMSVEEMSAMLEYLFGSGS
jgi:phospholipid/cholesterol/gamma-HCH transport system substrate-binding protein